MKSFIKEFQTKYTLEKRQTESKNILSKFPDKIPVIVARSANNENVPDIDKHKFLAPSDITFGQFIYVIRKRVELTPEKALFCFVNKNLIATGQSMSEAYKSYKEEDGFLYITYSGENTFG